MCMRLGSLTRPRSGSKLMPCSFPCCIQTTPVTAPLQHSRNRHIRLVVSMSASALPGFIDASTPSSSSSSPPAPAVVSIRVDDLRGAEIAALLHEHYTSMFEHSPPESVHALDLDSLRAPEIMFWSAWIGGALAGCVALKDLGSGHAELKSMRTAAAFMRRGVAAAMMEHVMAQARLRGLTRISLETGSMEFFAPARKMYERFGFRECGPFGAYQLDPYSVFMSREVGASEGKDSAPTTPAL